MQCFIAYQLELSSMRRKTLLLSPKTNHRDIVCLFRVDHLPHESNVVLGGRRIRYSRKPKSPACQASVSGVTRRQEAQRKTDILSVSSHTKRQNTIVRVLWAFAALIIYAKPKPRCLVHWQPRRSVSLSATADRLTLAGRSPRACLVGS